ncbi:hypothetical protein [Tsukamurella spumae]|uniref:hypothetical protein n=1 Tax=Tsukamurella spumae TaxID=44753 RepID=UPI0031E39B0F
MPAWLSKLLPALTEKLGLDKADGTTNDKTGGKGQGEDRTGSGAEGKGGAKVIGTDALGRTVTATLSPDGKTVEVTAKRPDGTEQRITLTIGADGTLTPVGDAPAERGGADAPGVDKPVAAEKPSATPTPSSPTSPATTPAAPPTGAPSSPNAAPGAGTGDGAGTGATASPTPAPAPAPVNPKVTEQPEPAQSGATEDPCPPGEQQGSGAEFAVTVP